MDILSILNEYPSLLCEIHGETGVAREAPLPLAQHLKLDPVADVARAMTVLARLRAQACLDALVAEGVPASQLFVSATGMGGDVGVKFVPQGTNSAVRRDTAPGPTGPSPAVAHLFRASGPDGDADLRRSLGLDPPAASKPRVSFSTESLPVEQTPAGTINTDGDAFLKSILT